MKNIFSGLTGKKYAHIWILAIIILVGIFFRTYHFHDWLQFKGDAFRDATLISNVYRVGAESVPLLGPRAGGTMLRLGPIFYDFQYIAAVIFHSVSAPVLAYPDLFFSILTIPVFYLFSRRYFSSFWSLAMALMLAVSFLAIEYGRFAWNPNSTLFFTLVFSYALLRLYDTGSEKQRPLLWASLSGIALAIASQLHFSAFLGLPLVLIFFVLSHIKDSKRALSYKVIFVFLLSVFVIYVPVLISEFFKHGENTRLFFSAISSKADSHGILQDIFMVLVMFAKYFLRISLGIVESGKTLLLLSGIFCGAGFLANVFLLRQEKDQTKRNFLQWTIILITVYFLLYIPLAYKIDRPRFSLPFMMLPYVYFGYIMVFLRKNITYQRITLVVAFLGLSIILFCNIRATVGWFSELGNSEQTITSTGEKNSKNKNFWLTWRHFERAAEVMDESCEKQDPVFFSMAKNITEYDHSVEYALLQREPRKTIIIGKKYSPNGLKGCYYFIDFPHETLPELVAGEMRGVSVDIGNLQVTQFFPKDMGKEIEQNMETSKKKDFFTPEKITRYSRLYWGDVWYKLNHW